VARPTVEWAHPIFNTPQIACGMCTTFLGCLCRSSSVLRVVFIVIACAGRDDVRHTTVTPSGVCHVIRGSCGVACSSSSTLMWWGHGRLQAWAREALAPWKCRKVSNSQTLSFQNFWRVEVVHLIVLACVVRATTKKVVNFSEEKRAPQRKSWLRLWICAPLEKSCVRPWVRQF